MEARADDPVADRWFSRDVAAIAAARGLNDVAPFFIDADAAPDPGGAPLGGPTVVASALCDLRLVLLLRRSPARPRRHRPRG
jgi:cytochrome oxidase assembly protein ShyY1